MIPITKIHDYLWKYGSSVRGVSPNKGSFSRNIGYWACSRSGYCIDKTICSCRYSSCRYGLLYTYAIDSRANY